MKNYPSVYWLLCGIYFFSAAVGGVFGPYWPLYLMSIGFDAKDISRLLAITMSGSFFAPYLWAWIADHTDKPHTLMRLSAALSLCSFVGILLTVSFWWLVLFLGSFIFFWNTILPQIEANTMNHLKGGVGHYGDIRLWGSMGFVIATITFGFVLDNTSISVVPKAIFVLLAVVVLNIFFFSKNETTQSQPPKTQNNMVHLLAQPTVLAFMIAVFMMFISNTPYSVFFSIYLTENGYDLAEIGWLWATGMIAQIIVFFAMSRLLTTFSFKTLLLTAYALTTLRWLLIGFYINHVPLLLFAQILQGANIGIFHTVSIYIIHYIFKGKYQYRGQAIYICLAGMASIVGTLGSGHLWERFPPSVSFSAAALVTAVALVVTWRYMGEIQNQ